MLNTIRRVNRLNVTKEYIKKKAEDHWKYTKGLMDKTIEDLNIINVKSPLRGLNHYLYVEAFIHGYEHGIEETKSSP